MIGDRRDTVSPLLKTKTKNQNILIPKLPHTKFSSYQTLIIPKSLIPKPLIPKPPQNKTSLYQIFLILKTKLKQGYIVRMKLRKETFYSFLSKKKIFEMKTPHQKLAIYLLSAMPFLLSAQAQLHFLSSKVTLFFLF